jgi:hypothetical protein
MFVSLPTSSCDARPDHTYGTSKGPEVQIDVGADVSLDMPFTQIEGTLLERAVQVLQRCVRETPPDLHAHWVRHSRETVYKE